MTMTREIPVDSIVIPARFVELCHDWAGGMGCMLRAVSSTGSLTIGTRRPRGCDTEEKWYLTLWENLAADVYYACYAAGSDHEDYAGLKVFEDWADLQVDRLERSYGLADWDACDD